jgi:hypothetical protein
MVMRARKRLEIIVEKRQLQTVLDVLDIDCEVTGYTVLPSLGGGGHIGAHLHHPCRDVLDTIVVAVSDVQVMRAAHF